MENYSFSEDAIKNAIEAAKATHSESTADVQEVGFNLSKGGNMFAGSMLIAAQCISIKTANHKICISLPLGIGKRCFTLPINIPNGSVGSACLSICTTWGIPTGIRVTVTIGGITVISQSFGKC